PGIRTVPCADRLLSPKPPFACMPPKLARFMQGSFVLEHNASLAREQKPSDSFEPDAGLLCQPKTHGKEDVPRCMSHGSRGSCFWAASQPWSPARWPS